MKTDMGHDRQIVAMTKLGELGELLSTRSGSSHSMSEKAQGMHCPLLGWKGDCTCRQGGSYGMLSRGLTWMTGRPGPNGFPLIAPASQSQCISHQLSNVAQKKLKTHLGYPWESIFYHQCDSAELSLLGVYKLMFAILYSLALNDCQ